MATQTTDTKSFIGRGKVYMRNLLVADSTLAHIGNCPNLDLTFTQEEVIQRDYQTPGGGNAAKFTRVSALTGAITTFSYIRSVIAAVMRAATTDLTAAVQTDNITITAGNIAGFHPFTQIRDEDIALTVTNQTGSVLLVEGTDYTVEKGGIQLIAGSANAPVATDVLDVGYTSLAGFQADPLTEAAGIYEIYFSGLNEADGNKPTTLLIRCAQIDVVSAMAFISADTEFGTLPFTFEALKDPSITAAGSSPYAEIKIAA